MSDVADDRGVREVGQDGRFEIEPLGLAQLPAREDLHRDGRAVGDVAGAVDRAHSSRAGEVLQVEAARYGFPDHLPGFGRKTVTLSR